MPTHPPNLNPNNQHHQQQQLYPFPTSISIPRLPTAFHFATHIYTHTPLPRTLILWADGSADSTRPGTPYAGATGYHDPITGTWHEAVVVRFPSNTAPARLADEAELLAISEGFRVAVGMVERIDAVLLFSDSQSVLRRFGRSVRGGLDPRAWGDLLGWANVLYDAGVGVELHWVPGKACIEGHHRVDELARDHRRLVQRIRPRGLVCCKETMGEVRIVPGDVEGLIHILRGLMERWGMFSRKEGEERERRVEGVLEEKREEVEERKKERVEKLLRRAEKKRIREEKREARRLVKMKRREEAEALVCKASKTLGVEVAQLTLPDIIDFIPWMKPRQETPATPLPGASS